MASIAHDLHNDLDVSESSQLNATELEEYLHGDGWAMSKAMFDFLGETARTSFKADEDKVICEAGFRYGTTAMAFLCLGNATSVKAYSRRDDKYVQLASNHVKARYPGRLDLVIGDTANAVSQSASTEGWSPCGLIYIDGNRGYEVIKEDLQNFAKVSTPGAMVLVDGCGNSTGERRTAFDEAAESGLIVNPDYKLDVKGSSKTICVGRFTSTDMDAALETLKGSTATGSAVQPDQSGSGASEAAAADQEPQPLADSESKGDGATEEVGSAVQPDQSGSGASEEAAAAQQPQPLADSESKGDGATEEVGTPAQPDQSGSAASEAAADQPQPQGLAEKEERESVTDAGGNPAPMAGAGDSSDQKSVEGLEQATDDDEEDEEDDFEVEDAESDDEEHVQDEEVEEFYEEEEPVGAEEGAATVAIVSEDRHLQQGEAPDSGSSEEEEDGDGEGDQDGEEEEGSQEQQEEPKEPEDPKSVFERTYLIRNASKESSWAKQQFTLMSEHRLNASKAESCGQEMAEVVASMKGDRSEEAMQRYAAGESWAINKGMFEFLGQMAEKELANVDADKDKVVCETGFRLGTTALAFTCFGGATQVRAYNRRQGDEVSRAEQLIHERYPHTLVIVHGNSEESVRDSLGVDGWMPCNVILVNGGKRYQTVEADLKNFAKWATPGALVMVDGCSLDTPHERQGPRLAFDKAVADGLVQEGTYITGVTHYNKTICTGRFTGAEAESAAADLITASNG